jgi:hypothetical protein
MVRRMLAQLSAEKALSAFVQHAANAGESRWTLDRARVQHRSVRSVNSFVRAWLVSLALLAGSPQRLDAQEHAPPRYAGAREHGRMGFSGSYLLLGPTLSGVLGRSAGDGVALGGELSFANVSEPHWLGAYFDASHTFNADETRVGFGPEVGLAIFGLDAGYVLALGGADGTQHGLALRPMLTIGFASAYFRSTWLFGADADWFAELGIMLKAPIPIANEAWF